MPTTSSDGSARIGVLVSGSGTNLQALLDATAADPSFGGRIVVVGSDKPACTGLERARSAGVATFSHDLADFASRPEWEAAMVAGLHEAEVDVVVLAGFMRLVTGDFLAHWPDRVVNTHPSLLPSFRGAHAVRDALAHGVKVTGVTVHLVDEEVDHGPILAQVAIDVRPGDDEDAVHERIKAIEHTLVPSIVSALCRGAVRLDGRVATVLDPTPTT